MIFKCILLDLRDLQSIFTFIANFGDFGKPQKVNLDFKGLNNRFPWAETISSVFKIH